MSPIPDNTDTIGKLDRQTARARRGMEEQSRVVASPHLLGGMVKSMTRDQLSLASGEVVRNMRIREEDLRRRPGTALFGGSLPNAEPVLGIVMFINEAGDVWLIRITQNAFHVANASVAGWTEYEIINAEDGVGSFPKSARLSYAQFFESLYIADGVNRIWEVNFGQQKVRELKDAPRTQFIMTFAERIVAANINQFFGGVRPSGVAWPVNADPRDWTGLGSGNEDLAMHDVGDAIAGLVSLENDALIIRRNSIWVMSRQPFEAPVFRFRQLMHGIGCDLPYSITRVPGGVIWADQRSREVYLFSLSEGPQRLASPVNEELFEDLKNLSFAQGVWDPFEREYHLALAFDTDGDELTRTWVLDLERRAWIFDDSPTISTLGVVSLPGEGVAIDDLVGTIDAQVVEIDEYGEDVGITPSLFKGITTGQVIKQTYDAENDWDGTVFEGEFHSQNFGSQTNRRSIKDLALRVVAENGGDVLLEERADESWRFTKTTELSASGLIQNVRIPRKGPTGNDLFWRVRTTAPGVKLKSYWVRLLEKSRQR